MICKINSKISKIYFGGVSIAKVYKGNKLCFNSITDTALTIITYEGGGVNILKDASLHRSSLVYYGAYIEKVQIGSNVKEIDSDFLNGELIQKDNFINYSILDASAYNYWGCRLCDTITDDGIAIADNTVIGVLWRKYKQNISIPEGVTEIKCLENDLDYGTIYIPNSVTKFSKNIFGQSNVNVTVDEVQYKGNATQWIAIENHNELEKRSVRSSDIRIVIRKITYLNISDYEEHIIRQDFEPKFTSFYDTLPICINDGWTIEVSMDLSNSTAVTENKSINFISFGDNIATWKSNYYQIMGYYNMTGFSPQSAFGFDKNGLNKSNNRAWADVSANNKYIVKLNQNGLWVNNVCVADSNDSVIAKIISQSEIQVGAAEGKKSDAYYDYIKYYK